MRSLTRAVALFFGLALLVAGCDSSENGENPNSDGTLTASVNGSSFSAALVTATGTTDVLAVAGVTNIDGSSGSNQRQLVISVAGPSVGTHHTSMQNPGVVLTYIEGDPSNLATYVASGITGSGTVVISELSASGAKGTFEFTAFRDGNPNSGDQVEVTNGSFDVTF